MDEYILIKNQLNPVDELELFQRFYEIDENYIDNKLFKLKNVKRIMHDINVTVTDLSATHNFV